MTKEKEINGRGDRSKGKEKICEAKTRDIAVQFKTLFVSTICDIKIPQLCVSGTVAEKFDYAEGGTIEVTNIESEKFDEDTARQIIEEVYTLIKDDVKEEINNLIG